MQITSLNHVFLSAGEKGKQNKKIKINKIEDVKREERRKSEHIIQEETTPVMPPGMYEW